MSNSNRPDDYLFKSNSYDASLLTLQQSHISNDVLSGQNTDRLLMVRHNLVDGLENVDPKVSEYLEQAKFHLVNDVGRCKIDHHLISAMVERWRPETHSFHLPWGECTITLEDVVLQLGIPIDGNAITGSTSFSRQQSFSLCQYLLGDVPPLNMWHGNSISLSWFTKFAKLPQNATDNVVQQYARGHIMRLIGGFLFPDKSDSRVHIMYLPLLEDLSKICDYS